MGKSLKLVNKDKKKDFFINTPYKQKKSKAPKATPLIYAMISVTYTTVTSARATSVLA